MFDVGFVWKCGICFCSGLVGYCMSSLLWLICMLWLLLLMWCMSVRMLGGSVVVSCICICGFVWSIMIVFCGFFGVNGVFVCI